MNNTSVSPFGFGYVDSQIHFVNRTNEIEKLTLNFRSHINTILISPRRWGKTTLLRKAGEIFEKENGEHRVCHLDLFNIHSNEEFYTYLSKSVIKSTNTKLEGMVQAAKQYLSRLSPSIKFGDSLQEVELGFDVEIKPEHFQDLLDLPEKIAAEKGIKLIIAIDEFQNCVRFGDHIAFQQKLRAAWQHHKHVTYCIYGSKRSMLIDFFENRNMPFYRFGEIIYLQKIEPQHWQKFIKAQFEKSEKHIEKKFIDQIIEITNNHPYYIQYLSHLIWQNTVINVSEEKFDGAINELMNHQSPLFQMMIESLSEKQVNLLKALVKDTENLTSQKTLKKFSLGSSANVIRMKEALENKDIIDMAFGQLEFVDPLFRFWLKRIYFGNRN